MHAKLDFVILFIVGAHDWLSAGVAKLGLFWQLLAAMWALHCLIILSYMC